MIRYPGGYYNRLEGFLAFQTRRSQNSTCDLADTGFETGTIEQPPRHAQAPGYVQISYDIQKGFIDSSLAFPINMILGASRERSVRHSTV
jgi:hypothetical protein